MSDGYYYLASVTEFPSGFEVTVTMGVKGQGGHRGSLERTVYSAHAWTARAAERKARRAVARLKREDEEARPIRSWAVV